MDKIKLLLFYPWE